MEDISNNLAFSIVQGFLNPATVQETNENANQIIEAQGFSFFFNYIHSIFSIPPEFLNYKSHAYNIGYAILKKCLNLCLPELLSRLLDDILINCLHIFELETDPHLYFKISDYFEIISKFLDSEQYVKLMRQFFQLENPYYLIIILSTLPSRDLTPLFSEVDFMAYYEVFQKLYLWIQTLTPEDPLYFDILVAWLGLYSSYVRYFSNLPNYADFSPFILSIIHLLNPQDQQIPDYYALSMWHTISNYCDMYFLCFQELLVYANQYPQYQFSIPQLSYEPFYIALSFLDKTKITIPFQMANTMILVALSILKSHMGPIDLTTDPSTILIGLSSFSFFANCNEAIINLIYPKLVDPLDGKENDLGKMIRMFYFEIAFMIHFPSFSHSEMAAPLLDHFFRCSVDPSFPFQIRYPLTTCLNELLLSQPDLAVYVGPYFQSFIQNLRWAQNTADGFQLTFNILTQKFPNLDPSQIIDYDEHNLNYYSLINILIKYSQIEPLDDVVLKYIVDTAPTTTSPQDFQHFSLIVQLFCSPFPNNTENMDYVMNLFLTLFQTGVGFTIGARLNFLTPIFNIMQSEPFYYAPTATALLQFFENISQQVVQDPVTTKAVISEFAYYFFHLKNIMNSDFYSSPQLMVFLSIFYQYLLEEPTPENLISYITCLSYHAQVPLKELMHESFTYEQIVEEMNQNPIQEFEAIEPPEIIEKRKKFYVLQYYSSQYERLLLDSMKELSSLLPENINMIFQEIIDNSLNQENYYPLRLNSDFIDAFAKSLTPDAVIPVLTKYAQIKERIDVVYMIITSIFKYWATLFFHESLDSFSRLYEIVGSFYNIAFSQSFPSEFEANLTYLLYFYDPTKSFETFTNFLTKCLKFNRPLIGFTALAEIFKFSIYSQISAEEIQFTINYINETADVLLETNPLDIPAFYYIVSSHLEIPIINQPDFFKFPQSYTEICQLITQTYLAFFLTVYNEHPDVFAGLNYDGGICIIFLACLAPQSIPDEMIVAALQISDVIISSSSLSVKCLLHILETRPHLAPHVFTTFFEAIGSASICSYDDLDEENQQLMKQSLLALPDPLFYEMLSQYRTRTHFYERILAFTEKPPLEEFLGE